MRRSEPDGVLAGRAARGDGVAFTELARRYGDLIGYCTHMPAWDHDREDERQEALIGLFEACRVSTTTTVTRARKIRPQPRRTRPAPAEPAAQEPI